MKSKGMKKKWLTAVLATAIIAAIPCVTGEEVWAAETSGKQDAEVILCADTWEEGDSYELLQGYLDQKLLGDLYGTQNFAHSTRLYDSLNDIEKQFYNQFHAKIEAIAGGSLADTSLECSVSNVPSKDDVSLEKIRRALRYDFPYDFFWCGLHSVYGSSYDSSNQTLTFRVYYEVNKDFRPAGAITTDLGNSNQLYLSVDTAKVAAVQTSISNAKKIVEENQYQSDIQKLINYKNVICELVTYNNGAANDTTEDKYGNPWQFVWVFDDNPDTNVVCEGYAKAFQYLCDMSTFSGKIYSYIAEGKMNGGAHMWNIVSIEDKNYLVDVTNCDGASVGAPSALFLAGGSGSIGSGYTFTLASGSIPYTYSSELKSAYGDGNDSILNISDTGYTNGTLEDVVIIANQTEVVYGSSEAVCLTAMPMFSEGGYGFPTYSWTYVNNPSGFSPATGDTFWVNISNASGTNRFKVTATMEGQTVERFIDIAVTGGSGFTPPKAVENLVYTGSPQALITAGSIDGGTMYYSVKGGSVSDQIPTATDAGTYQVQYWKPTGGNQVSSLGSIFVEIAGHQDANSDGLCDDCENLFGTRVAGKTITLGDKIGVNFYVEFDASISDKTAYQMKFTINDRTQVQTFDAGKTLTENGKTFYGFTCDVYATEMADTITAVLTKEGLEGKPYTYRVLDYAHTIIYSSAYNEKTKNLVKAMLNYGGYAQMYFKTTDYVVSNTMANAGLYSAAGDPVKSVDLETLSGYAKNVNGSVDGLSLYGSSLLLGSQTTIRHYFTLGEGKNISDYTFRVGEEILTAKYKSPNLYYVDISHIAPEQLNEMYELTVTGQAGQSLSVSYSALTYAYNMRNQTSRIVDVVKAMYLYYQACDTFLKL